MPRIAAFLGLGVAAWSLAHLAACPGPSGTPDAGDTDGDEYVDPIVDISGKVVTHPTVAAWYQKEGRTPPSIAGMKLEAEEPLLASRDDPAGTLQVVNSLPADGTFTFTKINTRPVILGLAASLRDERPTWGLSDGGADGGIADSGGADAGPGIPAGYRQFVRSLSALAEGKPKVNVTGVEVYAFASEYEKYLNTLMPADAGFGRTLEQDGFLFGLVVDKNSAPVAGVTVRDKTGQVVDNKIIYFNDPITAVKPSTDPTTGANGLFLVRAAGVSSGPPQFTVWRGSAQDLSYPSRLGGTGEDTVYQLVLRPK